MQITAVLLTNIYTCFSPFQITFCDKSFGQVHHEMLLVQQP